jgi:hypothetical protein
VSDMCRFEASLMTYHKPWQRRSSRVSDVMADRFKHPKPASQICLRGGVTLIDYTGRSLNVYLSSLFCLLALTANANSIRRRIPSEREGLSF